MRISSSQIRLLPNMFGKDESEERQRALTAIKAIFPDAFRWEALQQEVLFKRHDFAGGDMVVDIFVNLGAHSEFLCTFRPGQSKEHEVTLGGYVYRVTGDTFHGVIKVFRCAE